MRDTKVLPDFEIEQIKVMMEDISYGCLLLMLCTTWVSHYLLRRRTPLAYQSIGGGVDGFAEDYQNWIETMAPSRGCHRGGTFVNTLFDRAATGSCVTPRVGLRYACLIYLAKAITNDLDLFNP
jgi:hypothetical protein